MSKLFKLKEWLTISDTARHLSGLYGESVSEADILQLGLDGHLRLSIYFGNRVDGVLGVAVPETEGATYISPLRDDHPAAEAAASVGLGKDGKYAQELPPEVAEGLREGSLINVHDDIRIGPDSFFHPRGNIVKISGVWDLLLCGSGTFHLRNRFNELVGLPLSANFRIGGILVKDINGDIAALQTRVKAEKRNAGRTNAEEYSDPLNYRPNRDFPNDAALVVRTSALNELQQSMMEKGGTEAPPESTREKNNLLRIIGLMANHRYSAALENPYTIATMLINKAGELGAKPPSDGSIVRHVNAAIELLRKEKIPNS